jgi:hypothetical protein
MAARKKIFHDANTRAKIQTSQLINRLEKHILAEIMTQSQVTAAIGLLKKTLPDLSAVEHSGEISTNNASELTEAELINRITELEGTRAIKGASKAEAGKKVTH